MQGFLRPRARQRHLQCGPAPTQGRIIRNRYRQVQHRANRCHQSLGLAQAQVINLLQRRHRQNRRIAIGAWMASLGRGCRFLPRLHHILGNPHRQTSPLYQRSVILAPVAEAILGFGLLVLHTSRIPTSRPRDYFCNNATGNSQLTTDSHEQLEPTDV